MSDIVERAKKVKVVIFDVDGVLTDGSLFIGDDGQEYKAFNSRDGHGLKMLQNSGVTVAIITGRTSEVVKFRMRDLGVKTIYQGQHDKTVAFKDMLEKLNVTAEECAYVGDDVVDLPVMGQVGFAIAVADAHPMVIEHSHWQTPHNGGRSAGRDVCEFIMDAQGNLAAELDTYLYKP